MVKPKVHDVFTRSYEYKGSTYYESRRVFAVGWLPEIHEDGVCFKLVNDPPSAAYHFVSRDIWDNWQKLATRE